MYIPFDCKQLVLANSLINESFLIDLKILVIHVCRVNIGS